METSPSSKDPSRFTHSTPVCTPISSPQKHSEMSFESISTLDSPVTSPAKDPNGDASYLPDSTTESILDHSCESENGHENIPELCVRERKFMVFESTMDSVFHKLRCPDCSAPVDVIERRVCGSMLHVDAFCISGHVILDWDSQPMVGNKMPVGNLMIASATLFSGLTYGRVAEMSSLLNLQVPGCTSYYKLQRNILLPVVERHWKEEQGKVVAALSNHPITLAGDGRCDSPGFSAKYCTYTLMDNTSQKVVDFELVQVTEATSSVGMEKVGFEKVMDRIVDSPLTVTDVSTDRHVSIKKLMKDKYSRKGIGHQFDPYHVVNWVRKKLTEKAKYKKFKALAEWIKSVCNHLWWSALTCEGNPNLLVEKWESVLMHVTNQHSWEGKELFHACEHSPLPGEEARTKKWIRWDSFPFRALEEVVLNKNLLKDIEKLSKFLHTGQVEVYHSLMNKYSPKRCEFDRPAMIGRMQLTALNHNHNTGRSQRVICSDGQRKGQPMYRGVWSKATQQWVAKPITEEKCYDYLKDMMAEVIRSKDENLTGQKATKSDAKNIAKVVRPSLAQLITKHKSRFLN